MMTEGIVTDGRAFLIESYEWSTAREVRHCREFIVLGET